MKKIFGIMFALLLVFTVSGQAMAAFTPYNVQLVVYDNPGHLLNYSLAGIEKHIDLGDSSEYSNETKADYTIDTGIMISNFTAADAWNDLYVGIVGGADEGVLSDGVIATKDQITVSDVNIRDSLAYFNLGGAMGPMKNAAASMGQGDNGSYSNLFNQAGSSAGSYSAALLVAGHELQLSGATQQMYFYSIGFNDGYTALELNEIGTFTFSIDPTDSSLKVNYSNSTSAVPIPASLLLFGSGLLGLFGIRRKISK